MNSAIRLAIMISLAASARAQQPCCEPHAGTGCHAAECAAAVCALDPFCCSSSWDARCAAEASVACDSCRPPTTCVPPPATLADVEACGSSTDDPCAPVAGSTRVLTPESVAIGSVWSTTSARDVDWFEVNLAVASSVRVELWTAGPVGVAVLDTTCPPTVHAEAADGCPSICETCLPAGTWRITVRPLLFEPMPCGDPRGQYAIRVGVVPCEPTVPVNDRCDNPAAMGVGVVSFDCTHASTEPAWLPASCDEGSGLALTHDVWFAFTAPESATYTFSTCGVADFDARIALYDQCGGVVLACSDDACTDGGASMSAAMSCGQTALLRVGGWGHGSSGALRIEPNLTSGCDCAGDLDASGEVDGSDVAVLLLNFGEPAGASDLDGDGEVGSADLGLLLLLTGPCG